MRKKRDILNYYSNGEDLFKYQFQQRLKKDFVKNARDRDKKNVGDDDQLDEWDNRKYFLHDINDDGVAYLNYNKKEDKITHNTFVLLDGKHIHAYDEKFNFFDSFEMITNEKELLMNVFSFLCDVCYLDFTQLICVCKKWYHMHWEYKDQSYYFLIETLQRFCALHAHRVRAFDTI